jgi:hypothetical protein
MKTADHLIFVKNFLLKNDDELPAGEKHSSFIIYSLRRKDKGQLIVRVRIAVKNVVSAYYCFQHKFTVKNLIKKIQNNAIFINLIYSARNPI